MTKPKSNGAAYAAASPSTKPYKRKRKQGEERWYAVRAGRVPGVYDTWAECQANIVAFRGAVCESILGVTLSLSLHVAGSKANPDSQTKTNPSQRVRRRHSLQQGRTPTQSRNRIAFTLWRLDKDRASILSGQMLRLLIPA